MNKQWLEDCENSWNALLHFTMEFGISRVEFMERITEIENMVNQLEPTYKILERVAELSKLCKQISSNSTAMNK